MRLGEHAGMGAGKLRQEIGALWRPKPVLRLRYDALMLVITDGIRMANPTNALCMHHSTVASQYSL